MTAFVAVNSAQSRRPRGTDPWVQATLALLASAEQRRDQVVTSVGLNTWEMSLWAAGQVGLDVRVVLPPATSLDVSAYKKQVARDFGLDPAKVSWTIMDEATKGTKGTKATRWESRDRTVLRLSQRVFPISVRGAGRLSKLLAELPKDKLEDSFRVPYQKPRREKVPWFTGQSQRIRWPRRPGLMHLTRGAQRWPGETSAQYYAAVAASGDRDPRSGFETLRRMVRERRIRGSGKRIAGGRTVVCWSARSPEDILELVRMRRRFARWAFEPYGVWISEQAAVRLGVRPVGYGEVTGQDAWLRHSPGAGGIWKAEREWRNLGDVPLGELATDEVEVWTATDQEAQKLRRETDYRVRSFGFMERV